MANTKDVSFSIDLNLLNKQLEAQRVADRDPENDFSVKTTVFTLGKDPRVGTKPQVSAPNFTLIQILKDRMDNPFNRLNWQLPRSDIDAGGVIGFNIYRKDLGAESALSFNGVMTVSRVAFDKLSQGNIAKGKFSAERKALYNVKRKSVPILVLNPNLANLEARSEKYTFNEDSLPDSPSYTPGGFERTERPFVKIGYVDYTAFSAQENKKFLTVTDKNIVKLTFDDKKVGYFETFEYYIESVSQKLGENPRSEVIRVTVEDTNKVIPPEVIAKQINETSIQLAVRLNPSAKIARIFVYRKASDAVSYEYINVSNNVSDVINIVDPVQYRKTYTYRVFAQNIYGNLSEPAEITVFSSVQRVVTQSRSNSLKSPIITALQDQNSDFVKVIISPNDPNIAFYELKRKDLSIYERRFAVPSKEETNFGGTGWVADKFFVEKEIVPIESSGSTDSLKTKTILKEIVFVDDTVDIGHIYQYRTCGYDLFGNPSAYGFSMVRVEGKKSIRTPINIRAEVVRGYPFRVKIMWDDDNLASEFSASMYRVERRKLSEVSYESFPLTANKFIIDEVSTSDAVLFDGTAITDTYTSQSNMSLTNDKLTMLSDMRRAYNLPEFLVPNDTYFYRITAVASNQDVSNASAEFQVATVGDLSNPLNFNVTVLNTKVAPISARVSWEIEDAKERPDFWLIEKKYDTPYDSFVPLGKAYLATEIYDRNVEPGYTYIYRIKGFDSIGRESAFVQTTLTL